MLVQFTYMNIFGLGPAEIAIILFVLLLFFGKDRLPGLAKSLGESFREVKNGFTNPTPSETKSHTESVTATSTDSKSEPQSEKKK